MAEIRNLTLKDGSHLELSIMPGFYDAVRRKLGLSQTKDVSDDDLRTFLYDVLTDAEKGTQHE